MKELCIPYIVIYPLYTSTISEPLRNPSSLFPLTHIMKQRNYLIQKNVYIRLPGIWYVPPIYIVLFATMKQKKICLYVLVRTLVRTILPKPFVHRPVRPGRIILAERKC